jgi:excisionase family DNA binding protein
MCFPVLLSSRDVAKLLHVSRRTICLWSECGELPGFKLGRQWRFRREVVDSWLDAMCASRVTFAARLASTDLKTRTKALEWRRGAP